MLKLSTKMRYGTRALAELADAGRDEITSVKTLAESQKLSIKYLEQIMASLKGAAIVDATSGVHGGYRLARAPEKICMLEVFEVLEGKINIVHCVDLKDVCDNVENCPTRPLWKRLTESMRSVLTATTLADLVRERHQVV